MRAYATFLMCHTGQLVDLGPGDIIGRSPLAALCVEDPRLSEAHCMVSLRGHALMLLSLRGRFRVDGKFVPDLTIEAGQKIEFAPGVEAECLEVHLPQTILAIEAPGLPTFGLGSTTSIWVSPARVSRGFHADADAVFWAVGARWKATTGVDMVDVESGSIVTVKDTPIRVVTMRLREAALSRTRRNTPGPLTWVAYGHAVRLQSETDADIFIGGVPGRILDTLLRVRATMHWRDVAEIVWPHDASLEQSLRKRLDVGIARLRDKLAAIVEDDLITLDGSGVVSLTLRDQDGVDVLS